MSMLTLRSYHVANLSSKPPTQVELNYEAFRDKLPGLLPAHGGEFALMRDGDVVDFFHTAMEAYLAGKEAFGLGGFSIQEVVDRVIDLGYLSHALPRTPRPCLVVKRSHASGS